MEIVCPACNARFALKVAKVPTTPFKAICGKCKQPFVVDPAKLSGGAPAAGAPAPAAPEARRPEPVAATPPEPVAAPPPPQRPEPVAFTPPPVTAPPAAPLAPRRATSADPGGTTSLQEAVAEAARVAAQRAAERVDIPLAGGAIQAPAAPEDGSLAQAPIEEFSETLRLALICDPHKQRQEHLATIAVDLGYRIHIPPTPREPVAWVQQNRYHLVLVHEDFKSAGEEHDVLAGLNRLHGALRRSMCVGLLGNNLRTLDNATAFHRSVNFVLGVRDLGRARSIIRSAVADTDEFYRVFRETMKTLGKI